MNLWTCQHNPSTLCPLRPLYTVLQMNDGIGDETVCHAAADSAAASGKRLRPPATDEYETKVCSRYFLSESLCADCKTVSPTFKQNALDILIIKHQIILFVEFR